MHIDFIHGGSTDLELHFDFSEETEEEIRKQLELNGRANPEFEYAYFREDGVRCTVIRNTVAIRPAEQPGETALTFWRRRCLNTPGPANEHFSYRSYQ